MTIERRMARSAAWLIGLRLVDRSIGLVSMLFLARLLVPADFGLVAMGTVILGALEAVSAFGFEMALIKRQARDRARRDSAWTLNIIIGTVNAAVMILLAPVAAAFYAEPRVTNVMLVLAAVAITSGMRNIGMVEFEQDLRFGPIVALAMTRRVASFVITLVLALAYGNYWALLAGMVCGHVVDLLLSYRMSPYRPRLSLVAWRDLFSFSKWLLVNNVLSYAGNRGGDMIVGTRAGATALGTYAISLEISNLPTTEMVWPVMRAVFPGYAMMSAEPERLAQGFLKVFSIVVLFALPAAAGIALLAEPIVEVLLGDKWREAVPLIQVLAIVGGIRAAQANAGSIYMALDRPQIAAAITFLSLVVGLGSFAAVLGRLPLAQAVWALAIGGIVTATVNLTVVTRLLGLSWGRLLQPMTRPAIGIAAMTAVLILLRDALWTGAHTVATAAVILVALVLTGAIVYVASVLLAWRLAGGARDSAERVVLAGFGRVMRREAM